MKILRRLRTSRAFRNTAASYFSFASTAAWGLLTIPVAVAYLAPEQLGLWTIINAFFSYLIWMDLGVGNATGRIIAEAVAERDQQEINRWWTATRAVLVVQGLVLLGIGVILVEPLIQLLAVPSGLVEEARWILLAGVAIVACSLPMRGVPGLLTAQERFHWVPVVQGVAPWINFALFYHFLREGVGLRSYIIAMAGGQGATWVAFYLLVRLGPDRPRFDWRGVERKRFKKLFVLSGNFTVVGIIDTVLVSLPALIIGRLGGLAMVPVYHFTRRASQLSFALISRTYQAFYPALQKAYVTGRKPEFKHKHGQVGLLTLGASLMGGGVFLMVNTVIVDLLAGRDFFAGSTANAWFAASLVTYPISGFFRILLPISGSLGKQSAVSLLVLTIAVAAGIPAWQNWGLGGVACVFTLIPVISGVYSYVRGTIGCGFKFHELSSTVGIRAIFAVLLILGCGFMGANLDGFPLGQFEIASRTAQLPSLQLCLIAAVPIAVGALQLVAALRSFRLAG